MELPASRSSGRLAEAATIVCDHTGSLEGVQVALSRLLIDVADQDMGHRRPAGGVLAVRHPPTRVPGTPCRAVPRQPGPVDRRTGRPGRPSRPARRTIVVFAVVMLVMKSRLRHKSVDVHLVPLISSKAVLVVAAAFVEDRIKDCVSEPALVVAIGLGIAVALLGPLGDGHFFTVRRAAPSTAQPMQRVS